MDTTTKSTTLLNFTAKARDSSRSRFSEQWVRLPQAEYIQLKWNGNYWKAQHKQLKQKQQALEQELATATARIRDLKQRLYGKKSEKSPSRKDHGESNSLPPSKRPRGQQAGEKGHGRTPRPHLPVIDEFLDIADVDQKCPSCEQAYRPLTQTEDSEIIEIEVKAYVRKIKRRMYARGCECESVPGLITAPPASRLIPKSGIGISVWTEVLLNKFLFSRATHNLCTDYSWRGLPLAVGTLTGGLKRIAPLFEPLLACLLEKQMSEQLFHNDETGWKVFEAIEGKLGYRWWLWVTQSPSVVYYSLAPSRSGDIPIAHFAGLDQELEQVVVVCDRYSAYKRLARENPKIVLAFCWAHVRRDFLNEARSYPELEEWMFSWVERIGQLYTRNDQRLAHWDETRTLEDQSPTFRQKHQALKQALGEMKDRCDQTLLKKADLHLAQRQVLSSLKNHWQGLTVFVTAPQVPMDNNTAERRMRNPGMGRKNYYGSGSQWSAGLAASMFSLFQTMILWGLNPHHWLNSYLQACAEYGGQAPEDVSDFIPWMMSEQRKQQLVQPMVSGLAKANTKITSPPPSPP